MFCTKCGSKIEAGAKFCTHCGEAVDASVEQPIPKPHTHRHTTPTTRPFRKVKLLLAAILLWLICLSGYVLLTYNTDEPTLLQPQYDEENLTALNELGPYMQPVGYFDDMNVFDADISADEWFSHVQYLEAAQNPVTQQNKTFASVVKIICEDDDYIYYGSGTNVDPAGYVLTNHHVVAGLADDACLVGFPDPQTGLIREAYWSTIITDVENETEHDLAYLAIEGPIFDDEGNLYGYYNRVSNATFPYFEHTDRCLASATILGDELRILGYPPLSGGSLTVTNGLVSSLYSPDGYIVTSAKIVSGNSGGLAVDSNGCYVGVPTAVYYDGATDDEVLGEIIDAEFVFDFDRAIQDDLHDYYFDNGIEFESDAVPERADTATN